MIDRRVFIQFKGVVKNINEMSFFCTREYNDGAAYNFASESEVG